MIRIECLFFLFQHFPSLLSSTTGSAACSTSALDFNKWSIFLLNIIVRSFVFYFLFDTNKYLQKLLNDMLSEKGLVWTGMNLSQAREKNSKVCSQRETLSLLPFPFPTLATSLSFHFICCCWINVHSRCSPASRPSCAVITCAGIGLSSRTANLSKLSPKTRPQQV